MTDIHFKINTKNQKLHVFLQNNIRSFYDSLESYKPNNLLFNILDKGTEKTFTDIFQDAIKQNNTYQEIKTFQQLRFEKENNTYGFIDLIVELNKKTLFIIEAKSYWASQYEPTHESWLEDKTDEFYKKTLSQAESYFHHDQDFYANYKSIYGIALVFTRTNIYNPIKVGNIWDFEHCSMDEFYAFKKFNFTNSNIGFAVYGKFKIIR